MGSSSLSLQRFWPARAQQSLACQWTHWVRRIPGNPNAAGSVPVVLGGLPPFVRGALSRAVRARRHGVGGDPPPVPSALPPCPGLPRHSVGEVRHSDPLRQAVRDVRQHGVRDNRSRPALRGALSRAVRARRHGVLGCPPPPCPGPRIPAVAAARRAVCCSPHRRGSRHRRTLALNGLAWPWRLG